MSTFPVTHSILSPEGIAAFVKERYALNGDCKCRLLKAGINHTYRVESGSSIFIFRVYSYQWRTVQEIREELDLLLLLKENNISVSYPLADAQANYIQTLTAPEGERFAVLFSYAPGHKIQNYSAETHFAIGQLMAQIHRLTQDRVQQRVTYTPDVLLKQSLEEIKKFLPAEAEEMQFLQNTLPVLEKRLLGADAGRLRKGIVHIDIWFDNLNISDTNTITLFDFDFCGNGWLCLDLAYYQLQLHQTEKDEAGRRMKMSAFYRGYESIAAISDEERKLIPVLGVCLYYFYLGVQCSRFENWSNTFLNEVYLRRFVNVLVKGYYEGIGC